MLSINKFRRFGDSNKEVSRMKNYKWVIATYIIMQFINAIGTAFVFKISLYNDTEHALMLARRI